MEERVATQALIVAVCKAANITPYDLFKNIPSRPELTSYLEQLKDLTGDAIKQQLNS